MTLGWVIAGTVGQLMLAYLGLIGAIFGGGAASQVRSGPLSEFENSVLTGAIYGLPALSVITAVLVIALYLADKGPWSFAWHLLPVVALVCYGWYVFYWLSE